MLVACGRRAHTYNCYYFRQQTGTSHDPSTANELSSVNAQTRSNNDRGFDAQQIVDLNRHCDSPYSNYSVINSVLVIMWIIQDYKIVSSSVSLLITY